MLNQEQQCELVDVPYGEPCEVDQGQTRICDGAGTCIPGCRSDYQCDSQYLCIEGICNQAMQQCEPGDFRRKNTVCDQPYPLDDGFCDGAGRCVECNEDSQCLSDLNDCTAKTCNVGENECEQILVPDGTLCAGGVCQSGECALSGFEQPCTDQGIRNAIAAGGGPYTFDCDGPTAIASGEDYVLERDVSLDGESRLEVEGPFVVSEGASVLLQGMTIPGGGVRNEGRLTMVRTLVRNQGLTAILNAPTAELRMIQSLVTASGVGIYDGATVLINSTVSWNGTAFGSGSDAATLTLVHSTIGENHRFGYARRPTVVTVANSLVVGDCLFDDVTPEFVSKGYNLESEGDTCGFDQPTDQVGVSSDQLNLGDLADNGGPTMTHALGEGSVAIDQIPAAACVDPDGAQLATDQRGLPRDSMCDVGAFEVQP